MPIEARWIIYHKQRTEYERNLDVLKAIIKNAPTADLLNQLCELSIKDDEVTDRYNDFVLTSHLDGLNELERDCYAIGEMIRRIKEEIIRRCGQ